MKTIVENETVKWYREFCESIRNSLTACCNVHPEDAGSCYEGCCDKWRCPACGKEWIQELGD